MNNPTSIQIIGIIYLILGVLIAFLGVLAFIGLNFLPSSVKGASAVGGLVLLIMFGGIGVLVIFLGRGILKKNKTAWYIAFITSIVALLSSLSKLPITFIALLWQAFVVWKLYEHRKIFGI